MRLCLVLDILTQQEVELLHHRVVDFLAGDELPVVEAKAVIEQQLDVGYYQFSGVIVYRMLEFRLNHVEHLLEHNHLAL